VPHPGVSCNETLHTACHASCGAKDDPVTKARGNTITWTEGLEGQWGGGREGGAQSLTHP